MLTQATIQVILRKSAKMKALIQSGDRTLTTIIECTTTRGTVLTPMITFKGKTCLKAWREVYPEAVYGCSDNGWTDSEHGFTWLTKIFERETRPTDESDYRLLIIDGHKSHVTPKFIEHCWNHRIVPLCLPPHTTHYLQPLDVGLFSPLSIAYKRQLEERTKVGICHVDKLDFLRMLKKARDKAFTMDNIMGGWAGAGESTNVFTCKSHIKLIRYLPTGCIGAIGPNT